MKRKKRFFVITASSLLATSMVAPSIVLTLKNNNNETTNNFLSKSNNTNNKISTHSFQPITIKSNGSIIELSGVNNILPNSIDIQSNTDKTSEQIKKIIKDNILYPSVTEQPILKINGSSYFINGSLVVWFSAMAYGIIDDRQNEIEPTYENGLIRDGYFVFSGFKQFNKTDNADVYNNFTTNLKTSLDFNAAKALPFKLSNEFANISHDSQVEEFTKFIRKNWVYLFTTQGVFSHSFDANESSVISIIDSFAKSIRISGPLVIRNSEVTASIVYPKECKGDFANVVETIGQITIPLVDLPKPKSLLMTYIGAGIAIGGGLLLLIILIVVATKKSKSKHNNNYGNTASFIPNDHTNYINSSYPVVSNDQYGFDVTLDGMDTLEQNGTNLFYPPVGGPHEVVVNTKTVEEPIYSFSYDNTQTQATDIENNEPIYAEQVEYTENDEE